MSILKYWKEIGVVLLILGVISTGFFAVQKYNSTLEKNQELSQSVKALKDERKALEDSMASVYEAVDDNDLHRTQIIERTTIIERDINALPVTTECVDSPAVDHAIQLLRNKRNTPQPEVELP